MGEYKVDSRMIKCRIKSLSSKYNKADCRLFLERAIESSTNKKVTRKKNINRFFSECMSPDNANKYCLECIGFICDEEDSKYSNTLTESFIYRILPYVRDVPYLINQLPKYKHGISFNEYAMLEKSFKEFEACDRILENHRIIQELFDLDSFIESGKNKNLSRLLTKICDTIYENTKDEETPCQILAITLEESSYLLEKHGVKYDKQDMVKFITEYFLLKPNITEHDQKTFRNVLNDNYVLVENDTASIRYFTELYDASKSNIMHLLNKFIISESKDINSDFCYIIRTMPIGYLISREDFVTNFGNILRFINEHMLTDDYDFNCIVENLKTIPGNIKSQMESDTWYYNSDDLGTIINHYENAIESIDVELANIVEDKDRIKKLVSIKECYRVSIYKLDELSSLVYTQENLDIMNNIGTMLESSHAFYLNEFNVMRFISLTKTALDIDKYLKEKGKKLLDKISGKIKIKNIKDLKKLNIFETVTENGNSNICVSSFDIINESDFWSVHDTMTNICRFINESIIRSNDVKAYYIVNPDTVEIRLEDTNTILLSDEDKKEINESISYEDKIRAIRLDETVSILESIDVDLMENINNIIESKINNIDYDTFYSIIEASKFIDNITRDDIITIASHFIESHNHLQKNGINWQIENWKHESSPLEIQMEACNLISALLESDEEKKEINKKKQEEKDNNDKKSIKDKIKEKVDQKKQEKEDKKETDEADKKKNPFAGVNLNSLKLYVKGLKAKMKDMSNKEKQWSRDVDMTFNRLIKGCKDALVSDRREAIIKGSIIPSFSKCIKIGIAMAGLTFINPVAAAVTAIGGMAMSKNLTRKERLLLLDEINTELEVVEKEIDMAEGSKNMKKYRKLLQYKKDLQRQYQRIKYNIRIGKDILPGSTTGLKDKD